MSEAILKAEHIKKVYNQGSDNETEALHDISLEIYPGDFVAIMGPSGSGKSTLINILATLDRATKGKLEINGQSVSKLSSYELADFRNKNLGYIFQNSILLDNMDVYHNIAAPLVLAKRPRHEIDERVHALANDLGIESLLNHQVNQCSGGQVQRVAIARALISDPSLLVADEPTGALDSKRSHEFMQTLRELNEKGMTIILVTHDNMVASYAKKLIYIHDGNLHDQIECGDMSQYDFFNKIVELNAGDYISQFFRK